MFALDAAANAHSSSTLPNNALKKFSPHEDGSTPINRVSEKLKEANARISNGGVRTLKAG